MSRESDLFIIISRSVIFIRFADVLSANLNSIAVMSSSILFF